MNDIAPQQCDSDLRNAALLPRKWLILLVLLGLHVATAWSATASEPVPADVDDSLFASPTTRDHIGRVVVPVRINGRGPFRFIVDTGANHSTISPELAKALQLETDTGPLMVLDGITGADQVSYVSIDRLQAGDMTIDDTTLPVVPTSIMAGADGILGAAGMSQKSLLIDFQRNRVAITSHIDPRTRDRAVKIRAARVANGLIVLDTMVGRVHAHAVLDTGAERTLGNLALRDAVRSQKRPKRGFVAQVTSVYGATKEVEPGEIMEAPTISIASLRITDVSIVYGDFHIFKIWDMQNEPAMILGMDVLGTVASLNIDFKNQTVYVGNVPAQQDVLVSTHELSGIQSQRK